MHHLSLKIRRALSLSVFNEGQRELLISTALAQSIAYGLTLPSSPVESVSQYYLDTHNHNVNKLISEFNEHFVVRVSNVIELIKSLYTFRYNFVYNPTSEDVVKIAHVLSSADNDYVPQAASDIINANLDQSGYNDLFSLMTTFKEEFCNNNGAYEGVVDSEG